MNLPELLKIAEAAKNIVRDEYTNEQNLYAHEAAFNPSVAIELIKRLQEAEKFIDELRKIELEKKDGRE